MPQLWVLNGLDRLSNKGAACAGGVAARAGGFEFDADRREAPVGCWVAAFRERRETEASDRRASALVRSCHAELTDQSELGYCADHDVSQTHLGSLVRAKTSMTSMCPLPQAGQRVSDVPVRD